MEKEVILNIHGQAIKLTVISTEEKIYRMYKMLFFSKYNSYEAHKENRDVSFFIKENDEFLKEFRKFVIERDNNVTSLENDPDAHYMQVKDDLDPSYYRADLVNKIDMILYMRKDENIQSIDKYIPYIRPYILRDLYTVIKDIAALNSNSCATDEWMSEHEIYYILERRNSDLLFVFKKYIELLQDSVTRKYEYRTSYDEINRLYSMEDIFTYNSCNLLLRYTNEVLEYKSNSKEINVDINEIFTVMKGTVKRIKKRGGK